MTDGYPHGPAAPAEATAAALERAASARAVILVEGLSDQIAVETLASRQGRDLTASGVVVVPMGGIQAIGRYLDRFGPRGGGLDLVGLCDAGEVDIVTRALTAMTGESSVDRAGLARLGFFVCVRDLEDELIRACGHPALEALLETQGDLEAFRTLQKQPAWRGRTPEDQMHRWLRAGAGRNLRYAHILMVHTSLDRAPRPLLDVLTAADGPLDPEPG